MPNNSCHYGSCVNETQINPRTDSSYHYCEKHRLTRKNQSTNYYNRNKAKQADRLKKLNKRRKIAFVSMYGGKCNCCGEQYFPFLTLDHVKGNGKEARTNSKTGKARWCYAEYMKAVECYSPENYQVLCMNCNFTKNTAQSCPCKGDRLLGFSHYEDYERVT
ncbi:hypothetical protein KAR91_50050 [Candidatus Pacearchaeota archaeon]|nr:hypothetical protein [Candidatus Pacearchaeota archaeon]